MIKGQSRSIPRANQNSILLLKLSTPTLLIRLIFFSLEVNPILNSSDQYVDIRLEFVPEGNVDKKPRVDYLNEATQLIIPQRNNSAMFEDDATQILNLGKPQAFPKEIKEEFSMPPHNLPPNLKQK